VKLSEEQVAKLWEVQREYEEVLDKNCRVLVEYFKEVLVNENSDAGISPPSLILKSTAEGGNRGNKMGEMMQLLFFFKKKTRHTNMVVTNNRICMLHFPVQLFNRGGSFSTF